MQMSVLLPWALAGAQGLILSRDALQHNSFEGVSKMLSTYVRSNAKLVLIGSYPTVSVGNHDIEPGTYFSVDLKQSPFNLQPLKMFAEGIGEPPKYLYLYDRLALHAELESRGKLAVA